jgi:hypothetical protein
VVRAIPPVRRRPEFDGRRATVRGAEVAPTMAEILRGLIADELPHGRPSASRAAAGAGLPSVGAQTHRHLQVALFVPRLVGTRRTVCEPSARSARSPTAGVDPRR